MKRPNWKSHLKFARDNAGTMSAIDIAIKLGVTTKNLRWHCTRHKISLAYKSPPAASTYTDAVVKLSFDVEQVWKIPKHCFHQAHMGNFT